MKTVNKHNLFFKFATEKSILPLDLQNVFFQDLIAAIRVKAKTSPDLHTCTEIHVTLEDEIKRVPYDNENYAIVYVENSNKTSFGFLEVYGWCAV